MSREYVIRIVLGDEFYETGTTPEDDVKALESGYLTIEDLESIASDESECSISFEVRDCD